MSDKNETTVPLNRDELLNFMLIVDAMFEVMEKLRLWENVRVTLVDLHDRELAQGEAAFLCETNRDIILDAIDEGHRTSGR